MTTPPDNQTRRRTFSFKNQPLEGKDTPPHPPDCPCCRLPEGEGITAFQAKLRRYLANEEAMDEDASRPEDPGI
ncbi:MAG: hypothetical protein JJU11_01480 [Candidatus Sumerlaeia bacterium]|nr:hypothetical protein [Candidatus Sumerlaeia bacterium]